MEPKAKYTLVGSVVLLLTCLIVFAVLWLAEAGGIRGAKNYSIYFRKHNLFGLQVDSAVYMRGIKVGTVKSVEISRRNIEEVHVIVVIDGDAPVKTDSVALINRNLLTGFASLDLARGSQHAELRTYVPPDEDYPVIPEGASEIDQLADSLPQLLERAGQLTGRVSAMMSEENIESLTKSLKNVEQFTGVLAKNNKSFEDTLKDIQTAAEEFRNVTRALNAFTAENDGRLAQVSDALMKTLNELHLVLESFRKNSDTLMTSLAATSDALGQQTAATAQNVGVAAQTAATTLEGFEQPRGILTGPHSSALGPGER